MIETTKDTALPDFTINVPKETVIVLGEYPDFKFVCPNGTDIYTINRVLGEFLKWTRQQIQEQQHP